MPRWVKKPELARCRRPGYELGRGIPVPLGAVDSWIAAVRELGIRSILCLLDEDQLSLYKAVPGGLLPYYAEAGFGVEHLPVLDYLRPPLSEEQLQAVWAAYQRSPKPVLVHCSAGVDRTGAAIWHILIQLLEGPYQATEFWVAAPGGSFALRVGESSAELDRLLDAERVSTWAYITACNPASEGLPEAENAERMLRLEAEVRAAGYPRLPGEGVGTVGDWPPEPSLLILGLDEPAARRLAGRFGQAAILAGWKGEPARLLWIDPEDWPRE